MQNHENPTKKRYKTLFWLFSQILVAETAQQLSRSIRDAGSVFLNVSGHLQSGIVPLSLRLN
jgi:hypothetical protein